MIKNRIVLICLILLSCLGQKLFCPKIVPEIVEDLPFQPPQNNFSDAFLERRRASVNGYQGAAAVIEDADHWADDVLDRGMYPVLTRRTPRVRIKIPDVVPNADTFGPVLSVREESSSFIGPLRYGHRGYEDPSWDEGLVDNAMIRVPCAPLPVVEPEGVVPGSFDWATRQLALDRQAAALTGAQRSSSFSDALSSGGGSPGTGAPVTSDADDDLPLPESFYSSQRASSPFASAGVASRRRGFRAPESLNPSDLEQLPEVVFPKAKSPRVAPKASAEASLDRVNSMASDDSRDQDDDEFLDPLLRNYISDQDYSAEDALKKFYKSVEERGFSVAAVNSLITGRANDLVVKAASAINSLLESLGDDKKYKASLRKKLKELEDLSRKALTSVLAAEDSLGEDSALVQARNETEIVIRLGRELFEQVDLRFSDNPGFDDSSEAKILEQAWRALWYSGCASWLRFDDEKSKADELLPPGSFVGGGPALELEDVEDPDDG